MNLIDFTFYKNTPLTDFVNTIHFKNNLDRDNYFKNKYTNSVLKKLAYNHIRDRGNIKISSNDFDEFLGVNYCSFVDKGFIYYCYVTKCTYNNDRTVNIELIIDEIMTWFQGTEIFDTFRNLNVQRQHLEKNNYKNHELYLRTNDDVIKTGTKKYIYQKHHQFQDLFVIFQCSVDLESDFGTKNAPKINTSSGVVFDKITSPVNLYSIYLEEFNSFMKKLSPYPWITQNFKKLIIVPLEFIGDGNTESIIVEGKTLYKFKDGGKSTNQTLNALTTTESEFYQRFGLNFFDDKHLFRSEYCTIELHTWDGQHLPINPPHLLDNNLELMGVSIYGHENDIRIFPLNYRSSANDNNILLGDDIIVYKGDYLNSSINLNNFTELPILIKQDILNQANNANQRALAESKLVTNRVANIYDAKSSIESKMFDAINIVSNVSLSGMGERMSDEYDFYRQQKAQFADMSLAPPTITNQTNGNAFQIANDFYGVTLKLGRIDDEELIKVRRYYKLFGHQLDKVVTKLDNVESMIVCNYVQFKGNIVIPNIPVEYLNVAKVKFENGIRLWHYNNTINPMLQNIDNNYIRV